MQTRALLALIFLAACSRGTVEGQVVDRNGKPLSGVKVNVLGNTVKSDKKGHFSVPRIRDMPAKRVVAYFYKNGYFDYEGGQQVLDGSAYMKVAMTPREKVATVDSSADSPFEYDTLSGTVAAGSFINPKDGTAVSGAINLFVGTMNPDRQGFSESMPGRDFTARDGGEGVLSSAGAFVFEAEDENGDPVEIEEPIEICLAIPASMLAVAPDSMPLWQLDGGTWVETAVASRVGDQYCFELTGTGSLNCDLFSRTAVIQGTVCDQQGEPVDAGKPVQVFQNTTYTDENGQYGALVPACYNFIARQQNMEVDVPGIPAGKTRVVDFRCPGDEPDAGFGDTGAPSPSTGDDQSNPFTSTSGGSGANTSSGTRDNDPFANSATTGRTAHATQSAPPVPSNESWFEWTWRQGKALGRAAANTTFGVIRPMARGDSGNWSGAGDSGNALDSGNASNGGSSSGGGSGSAAGPDEVCTSGSDPFVQQAAGSAGQVECDGVSEAGSNTPFSRTVALDATSGSITLRYDHYGVPDRTIVSYEGVGIIDTGCASDAGTLTGTYSGGSNFLTVAVIPGCGDNQGGSTAWDFTLGCD